MKASVYIATSLDGFIARKNGALDWLDEANSGVPEGEDCGFQTFMDSVDILIMGRKTFEQVLSFGQWAYGKTPVIVLSSKPMSIPPDVLGIVTHSAEQPRALLQRLSSEGIEHVYIDGGATIQSFLSDNLIDEITITVIPVLLGEGISLFGSVEKDIGLTHESTQAFDFGFVQTTYLVKKPKGSV
jgi:dihydrofolate reductase